MNTAVTAAAAAVLAQVAGLQVHREHGFTYRGRPVDATGVELFVAGAFGLEMDTARDADAVLVAGRALALRAELAERFGRIWHELNAPHDPASMLDQAKYVRHILRELQP